MLYSYMAMKIIFRLHLFKFYILKGHMYCSLLESNYSFSDSAVWLLWYYTLQEKAPCYWNLTASGSQVAPGFDSVTFVLKSFFISSLKRESNFRWMYLTFGGHFYMSSWISRISLSSWLLPLFPCRRLMKIAENSKWHREVSLLQTVFKAFLLQKIRVAWVKIVYFHSWEIEFCT